MGYMHSRLSAGLCGSLFTINTQIRNYWRRVWVGVGKTKSNHLTDKINDNVMTKWLRKVTNYKSIDVPYAHSS